MSEREKRYTPGPWSIHKARDIPDSFEIHWEIRSAPELNSSTGWGVVNVHHVLRSGGHTEGEANARLIASAPDLLEALEALFILANHHCSDSGEWFSERDENREALSKAEHAIAKAYGDTQ